MQYYKIEKSLGNLANDNFKKLESLFPCVVKDGQVDFEELRELLGDFEEVDKEKYEMNWVGKKEAKKIALTPLDGKTLKYIKGDGKNEDTTENLYIEGDNLEVLKLLQNSYYGKVKMIYIDPPYNTGNDFIYDDNFKEEKLNIEILEGERNEYGERLIKNQKTSSHYHSKWLNMMYSRLIVCKNLLRDNGVIFISIDDNEMYNLKKICDIVFGEDNMLATFLRKCPSNKADSKHCAIIHDYILAYTKCKEQFISGKEIKKEENYPNFDKNNNLYYKTQLLRKWGEKSRRVDRPNLFYPIIDPDGKLHYPMISENEEGRWRWSKDKMSTMIQNNKVEFKKKNNKWIAYEKIYQPSDGDYNYKLYSTWIDNVQNSTGAALLKELFGFKIFDFPKPVDLITKLLLIGNVQNDDIVLDFFSGSATTAHAVLKLNSEDNKKRKYILVQIQELVDINSESYKVGYKNICEIGKERIRRAGDKIVEENKDNPQIKDLDIGFKVFRVEDSNIRWENQTNENDQFKYNLDGVDIDDIDFMPNTKDIDVVYEILLRHYGIPLTSKINKLDSIGDRTYTIEDSIIVCLETKITQDIIDKISELEPIKVIFRDSAFGDDISLKQNSIHRLNVLIEENNKNTTHVVEFI